MPGEDEGRQKALELAFRYLNKRDRTVAEVGGHLDARGVEPEQIDEAVEVLVAEGYLDDARYACRFAEDRRRLDGWGTERIERRLHELGVSRDDVAGALGGRAVEEELEAAVALLDRRLGSPPRDQRERQRALGLLARRGYELELAHDAIRVYEHGDRRQRTDDPTPVATAASRGYDRGQHGSARNGRD